MHKAKHKNNIQSRLLALTAQGLLYHCTACGLYNIISSSHTLQAHLNLLILYVPLFLFAVIRDKFSNFFLFLLFHILISGITLFVLPSYGLRIILGGCVILMALFSIHLRLKPVYTRRETCPPMMSVCLFLFIYVAAQKTGCFYLRQISYYEVCLFLILFVVHRSSINTAVFLKSNAAINNLPSGQIKVLNRIFLGFFIIFMVIGMAAVQYTSLSSFLIESGEMLLLILRRILTFILRLLFREASDNTYEDTSSSEPPLLSAEGEPSAFIQALEKILLTVFYLFIIFLAVYLILKLLYIMYKRFYEQYESLTDESEFLWNNLPVKDRVKKIHHKAKPKPAASANKKIRHMYKKYIRRQLGKNTSIPAVLTPVELEDILHALPDDPHVQLRIQLYEKARYSQLECDKQEVEMMKQNTRR